MHIEYRYHEMEDIGLYVENILGIQFKYIFYCKVDDLAVSWYLVSECIHVLVQWPD